MYICRYPSFLYFPVGLNFIKYCHTFEIVIDKKEETEIEYRSFDNMIDLNVYFRFPLQYRKVFIAF